MHKSGTFKNTIRLCIKAFTANAGKQLCINNITSEAQKMLFDVINDNQHVISKRLHISGLKNIDAVRAKNISSSNRYSNIAREETSQIWYASARVMGRSTNETSSIS